MDEANQDKALQEKIERERVAHEEDDVLEENIRIKRRFDHIWRYPSLGRLQAGLQAVAGSANGKKLLDYGCGRGIASIEYLKLGAFVFGIDISAAYVQDAARRAREANFDEDRFSFQVMDAHALTFDDSSFDVVIGNGILHHLDPDRALDEIHRVLKPGGRVVLFEPLADNPLLKLFRYLTPKARTVDEKPF